MSKRKLLELNLLDDFLIAVTDSLKKIHKIAETVKREEDVQLKFMKAFERRNMWINKGKELERENTERERQNTERERQRADNAEAEVMKLKAMLIQRGIEPSIV